jgi:hypothetical protein
MVSAGQLRCALSAVRCLMHDAVSSISMTAQERSCSCVDVAHGQGGHVLVIFEK